MWDFCNEAYGNVYGEDGWLGMWSGRRRCPKSTTAKIANDLRMKYIAKILLHSENENIRQVTKSVRKFLDLGGERIHELYQIGHKRIEERMDLYVD
ncbi:hypothetical protein HanRHA438_Chr06g0282921 [Helianthus annuus]|nr:hypothetical protein HanRHA438_Chr06g0282921 [Helianthus annuus]